MRRAPNFYTSWITAAFSETLQGTTVELLTTAADAGTSTTFDLTTGRSFGRRPTRATYESLFPHIVILVGTERDAHTVHDRLGTPERLRRSSHGV